jgi:aquaglyceroporin related protein
LFISSSFPTTITTLPRMSTTIQPISSSSESASQSTHSVDKTTVVYNSKMGGSDTTHDGAEHRESATVTPPGEEEAAQLMWPKTRSLFQDAFGEFMGTMILLLFGDGVVAQVVLSGGTKGDYQSINWGWG